MKKEIAKGIFSPVNEMFDRNKIISHFKDECLKIANFLITILNMHERSPLKISPEKFNNCIKTSYLRS